MAFSLLIPAAVGLAALALAKRGSGAGSNTDTSELTSPTDAQLTRAATVATTGLVPWVGSSGKNWQQPAVESINSKDPARMVEVATAMRLDGLVSQADELERHAGTITAKAAIVNSAIAQTSQILTGASQANAYQAQIAPRAVSNEPPVVDVPAELATAARQYADYIRGARKGAENKATVRGYQQKLGMVADGLFGAGDAVAMAAAGVAPPGVWYWPKTLSQGPDALAKVQAAIALAKTNRASKTNQRDWQSSYDAQSKSFRTLYGVNAKPRKATAADVQNVVTLKMDPALRGVLSELTQQSVNISGLEIGWFGSSLIKKVGKAVKSVAKVTVKVANPLTTIKAAAKVVKAVPKTASKAVKTAGAVGKFVVKQASKVTKSPFVKIGAAGLAILCPPIGAPAIAAVAAINKGSDLLSKTQQTAQAAAHMTVLAGKTVDALHSGTPKQKAAAKKLIVQTHAAAKKPGPDKKGATAGLKALAVASSLRANAVTLQKASSASKVPVLAMSGVLVSDSGKIVKGNYRAA